MTGTPTDPGAIDLKELVILWNETGSIPVLDFQALLAAVETLRRVAELEDRGNPMTAPADPDAIDLDELRRHHGPSFGTGSTADLAALADEVEALRDALDGAITRAEAAEARVAELQSSLSLYFQATARLRRRTAFSAP